MATLQSQVRTAGFQYTPINRKSWCLFITDRLSASSICFKRQKSMLPSMQCNISAQALLWLLVISTQLCIIWHVLHLRLCRLSPATKADLHKKKVPPKSAPSATTSGLGHRSDVRHFVQDSYAAITGSWCWNRYHSRKNCMWSVVGDCSCSRIREMPKDGNIVGGNGINEKDWRYPTWCL